jgi:hypothetical protein
VGLYVWSFEILEDARVCYVAEVLRSGVWSVRRYELWGGSTGSLEVDAHVDLSRGRSFCKGPRCHGSAFREFSSLHV